MSANQHLNPRQFFHASDGLFGEGDLIQPPAATGVQTWMDKTGLSAAEREQVTSHYSPEHVYHSSVAGDAANFGNHIYQVEPLTKVEHDPESAHGASLGARWTRNAGSARVVKYLGR